MSKNNGGPAFPQMDAYINANGEKPVYVAEGGMNLRDYFAAKAMQAIATQSGMPNDAAGKAHLAKHAYAMADAMLAARDQ